MKPKLDPNWKSSWRWLSMQLNVLASLLVAYVLASPEVLLTTLNQLPPEIRAYFPPMAGFVLFALVALARLWKQNHPKGPSDDQPK
jgi:hypothetical protein